MNPEAVFHVKKSWRLFLVDINVRPSHVLKLARLPEDLFCYNEPKLTIEEFFRFWCALERIVGEDQLLIELVNRLHTETFDPAVFAFLCSPCLSVALERLSQYEELISPIDLGITVEDDRTVVTVGFTDNSHNWPESFFLYKLLYINKFARLAIREDIAPIEMTLSKPVPNLSHYAEYFGVNLRLGSCNQIVFSSEDVQKPFLTEDSAMWDFFSSNYKIRKQSISSTVSAEKRLSNILVEMLPSGESSIEEASKRLAMSTRSLQRKLQQEQSNFKAILSSTRWELANRYLQESEVSVAEIAYLLAYNDTSSFQKAYKSWSGMTPSQYRGSSNRSAN